MRRRFFVDQFVSGTATIRGETAEHLGRVLRAEPGQLYELSDGGKVWLARLESVRLSKRGENCVEFSLIEPIPAQEPACRIEVLLSLVKVDRFEWCLEKATELGATEIVALAAARSEKALVAAAQRRRGRWEKILIESAQQCRRLRPPALRGGPGGVAEGPSAPLATPQQAFGASQAERKILLSERRSAPHLREVVRGTDGSVPRERAMTVAAAIGPEGGWTEEEISAARAAGFEEASLGGRILRTETAVLALLAILGYAWGD